VAVICLFPGLMLRRGPTSARPLGNGQGPPAGGRARCADEAQLAGNGAQDAGSAGNWQEAAERSPGWRGTGGMLDSRLQHVGL
jgi:hypothetical protein